MLKEKLGETWHLIEGEWKLYKDIGCDDFDKAAKNRWRIATGYATCWWTWLERVLKTLPLDSPLPRWIPQGELPQAGGTREYKGVEEEDENIRSID